MNTWVDCIPFIEFAYNRARHSATKLSPFEIIYGFNPLSPIDLVPIPQVEQVNQDGVSRGEAIKKLHETAKANLEKKTEEYKRNADKGRKEVTFEPGDWVWLHMRQERFPVQRASKLAPRGDGPFKVLTKINDNAYQLDLPGEFNISHTFNVADLSYYDAGDPVLRSKPSQEGGNDEDIDHSQEPGQVPVVGDGSMTRSKSKQLRKRFNSAIQAYISSLNPEDLNPTEPSHAPDRTASSVAAEEPKERIDPSDQFQAVSFEIHRPSDYPKTNGRARNQKDRVEAKTATPTRPGGLTAASLDLAEEFSQLSLSQSSPQDSQGKYIVLAGQGAKERIKSSSELHKDPKRRLRCDTGHAEQEGETGAENEEELEDKDHLDVKDSRKHFHNQAQDQNIPKTEASPTATHAPSRPATLQGKWFNYYTMLAGEPSTNHD